MTAETMDTASTPPTRRPVWLRDSTTPPLADVFRSIPVRASAGGWRRFLAFVGPGYLVAVGYMDPGNWATDIAGGSKFGYTLLSVILISNLMAILLQSLCVRLGVATGRDLAQACRDYYSRPVSIALWLLCEIAIVACDLAELLGSALALNLLFGIPMAAGVCLTTLDVLVLLWLQNKGFRYTEAIVVTLFGVYKGTLKRSGFWWVNPLTTRRKLSLRVRNFESAKLKVNERDGNPIEIATVVVWRIIETFEAVFNVDDYENFVHVQSEAAVRTLATTYPYDSHEDAKVSLRLSAGGEVADRMRHEVQERLSKAGIEVIEARISHLAYAPEIAGAMLRRQQASAVIAARQLIVEGAVGMVEMALNELSRKNVVSLDEERKAAMVSNLLVVLCSEKGVEPVVNAGTLYQ
jgi:hypothetical protein